MLNYLQVQPSEVAQPVLLEASVGAQLVHNKRAQDISSLILLQVLVTIMHIQYIRIRKVLD